MQKELRGQIENLPKSPGVYLFRNKEGEALYVGKAVDIRNRVRSYFQDSANLGSKTRHMVERIASIEHFETESEFTALLLEADLIKRLKPKYNQRFKDDKSYPLIEITKEKYPRVYITRRIKRQSNRARGSHPELDSGSDGARKKKIPDRVRNDKKQYFGPYPHGNIRKVLRLLRKSFPFRNCSDSKFARYKRLERGCLFADIDLCPAPCVGKITEEEYKVTLNNLKQFLQGKGSKVIKDLEREMTELSAQEKFEEAAEIRDQLDNLNYIRRGFRTATTEELDINLPEDRQQKELEALKKALGLPKLPKRIEAYDISNLQGKEATGSMVVFENARPKKSHYRRFKIRMEGEPDDVGMMREVLKRRFSRIIETAEDKNQEENRPVQGKTSEVSADLTFEVEELDRPTKNDLSFQSIPDLILIDGGKGQLNAAIKVLRENGLAIPIASLAKREEEVYFSTIEKEIASFSSRQNKERGLKSAIIKEKKESTKINGPISLPKTSPALQLLQRIRDESHRFALAYHRKLRSKNFTK